MVEEPDDVGEVDPAVRVVVEERNQLVRRAPVVVPAMDLSNAGMAIQSIANRPDFAPLRKSWRKSLPASSPAGSPSPRVAASRSSLRAGRRLSWSRWPSGPRSASGSWSAGRRGSAVVAVGQSFCAEIASYYAAWQAGEISDAEARDIASRVGRFVADLEALAVELCRREEP